ncbi:hypothetical protein [Bradyrhizobium sp. USDA 4520]
MEDEYFLADDCARLVKMAGFEVIGPFNNVGEALANGKHRLFHGNIHKQACDCRAVQFFRSR